MKKGSTLFLKFVICLIAIGAFIWLVWFPQLEGRAADLDLISIYKDPLIIYAYLGSIPFFVALYQAFKLFLKGSINIMSLKEPVMWIDIKINSDFFLESLVEFSLQGFDKFTYPPVTLVVFLAITDENIILETWNDTCHITAYITIKL